MALNMNDLKIGNKYERPYLAQLWGYKDFHAIARGVFTPKNDNKIILFITKEKQTVLVQYGDYYDVENGLLYMDGEERHTSDKKLIDQENEFYLLYRDKHHSPFIYYGQIYPSSWELSMGTKPSKFVFSTSKSGSFAHSDIFAEANTFEVEFSDFFPSMEGAEKIRQHIYYERSVKNRAKAIDIHGTVCKACGFDFNKVYGKELARNYIEVHHVKLVSEFEGIVDPLHDLLPVCANCHRMIHRSRDKILSIDELKTLINITANDNLKSF